MAISHFEAEDDPKFSRYKLFTNRTLRETVLSRLEHQFVEAGFCAPNPRVVLGLAAGKVRSQSDRERLQALFDQNGWPFWDGSWLRGELEDLAQSGYENSTAAVVSKLLLR